MTRATQPGLPAFIVFGAVVEGTIPHVVTDNDSAPILRPGETVLIDPEDREPDFGDLHLIEWQDGSRAIVTCWTCTAPADTPWAGLWWVGRYRIPATVLRMCEERGLPSTRFGDGPYTAEQMRAKLVGRVVGILESAAVEPMRVVGEARR